MKSSRPFSALAQKSLKMVEVEGGNFIMGDDSSVWIREKPEHKVELSTFFIATYPVNQALWDAVMGKNPSDFKGDRLPVGHISWKDCQKFLEKLNHQLGR